MKRLKTERVAPATLSERAQTRHAARRAATLAGSVLGPPSPRDMNPFRTLSVKYLALSVGAIRGPGETRSQPICAHFPMPSPLSGFHSSSAPRRRRDVCCWLSECRCGLRLPPHSRLLLYLNAALSTPARTHPRTRARKSIKGRPPGSCAWDRLLKRHGCGRATALRAQPRSSDAMLASRSGAHGHIGRVKMSHRRRDIHET